MTKGLRWFHLWWWGFGLEYLPRFWQQRNIFCGTWNNIWWGIRCGIDIGQNTTIHRCTWNNILQDLCRGIRNNIQWDILCRQSNIPHGTWNNILRYICRGTRNLHGTWNNILRDILCGTCTWNNILRDICHGTWNITLSGGIFFTNEAIFPLVLGTISWGIFFIVREIFVVPEIISCGIFFVVINIQIMS